MVKKNLLDGDRIEELWLMSRFFLGGYEPTAVLLEDYDTTLFFRGRPIATE